MSVVGKVGRARDGTAHQGVGEETGGQGIMQGTKITQQEADKLLAEGIAAFFDCPCECELKSKANCKNCDGYHGFGGFFETKDGARTDIILIINNKGCFIRAREDLVKSDDEIFVTFAEDLKDGEKLPNFEDVFEVRKF